MTDSGLPPSLPGDDDLVSSGPRPRASTASASATPSETPAPGGDSPAEDTFWAGNEIEDTPSPRNGVQGQLRTLIEWVAVAAGALAVALLIKAFLLQAFYIPTASMDPTLAEDDRVLVNKLSYKIGDVQRGDIIVFSRPAGAPGTIDDFIKRVVALPGETISFSEGDVFIDGRSLSEDYVHEAPTNTSDVIPGCDNSPAVIDTCRVPDDMVFVMGDNRVSSFDSRRFGPIDVDSIVGRAFLKVWPLGDIGFL